MRLCSMQFMTYFHQTNKTDPKRYQVILNLVPYTVLERLWTDSTWNSQNKYYCRGVEQTVEGDCWMAHPNIFAMLEKMRKEVEYSATQRKLVELGKLETQQQEETKYVHNEERLQRLAEQFSTR